MASYRIAWCRRWVKRAQELEPLEVKDAEARHPEVAKLTKGKKLLLTAEILSEIGFEDIGALRLLSEGATLAGPIEESPSFERQYKPCLATMEQLAVNSQKMNEAILRMTSSSGDAGVDEQLMVETCQELEKGWAEGPFDPALLEAGSTVSRRFALVQGQKTRMIDDFSVSGINDSCEINNKLDLHMIDTFSALVKQYFQACDNAGQSKALKGKTFDLKSAYRQVPIKPSHYKFAYFSLFNHRTGQVEVHRLKTMPFGATHSVYCFLRLARLLYAIATQGLYLMTTNFYDDFILMSRPSLASSASCSMEMVFLLTGWLFAQEGSKATSFDTVCRALGVQFDFNRSESGLLAVSNTEARRLELMQQINAAVQRGTLGKQETLSLRGRLGFADSFIHGRLGRLLLKNLSDHAYGPSQRMDPCLIRSLSAMALRLQQSKPELVSAASCKELFVYTDASYEPESMTGGVGGVLVNSSAEVVAWFGLALGVDVCSLFGAKDKGTVIYELEMLAVVLATDLWCCNDGEEVHLFFGDNDGVRFSLIRATANGDVAQRLIEHQLRMETQFGLRSWYARVPTEANIADFPSRGQPHELLPESLSVPSEAQLKLEGILQMVAPGSSNFSGGVQLELPR